jgi:hypothetical protein
VTKGVIRRKRFISAVAELALFSLAPHSGTKAKPYSYSSPGTRSGEAIKKHTKQPELLIPQKRFTAKLRCSLSVVMVGVPGEEQSAKKIRRRYTNFCSVKTEAGWDEKDPAIWDG